LQKYYLINLGCPKNEVDGQYLEGLLREEGFEASPDELKSDIIIINTCGFIVSAQEESINAILEAVRLKEQKDFKLIVVGCLSQRFKEELVRELPEVDVFMGAGIENEFRNLLRKIKFEGLKGQECFFSQPFARGDYSTGNRKVSAPSAYLKIAEGCDNRCSYCTIPTIRGPFRSRPLEDLIQETRDLVNQGVKEIILVAQDTGRYGIDLYEEKGLVKLLQGLNSIEELRWIRLMYLQPGGIEDNLLDLVAREKKILPYLEIPMQHIQPDILHNMNRPGDERMLRELVQRIRTKIPGVFLRTTFMVGFPGESEEDFERLYNFVDEVRPERMGVFKYSPEEGTPAARMDGQVPEKLKEERYRRLEKLQHEIAREKNQELVGETQEVLIEEIHPDYSLGRTGGDAPEIDNLVIVEGEQQVEIGGIYSVKIVLALEYELVGEIYHEFAQ